MAFIIDALCVLCEVRQFRHLIDRPTVSCNVTLTFDSLANYDILPADCLYVFLAILTINNHTSQYSIHHLFFTVEAYCVLCQVRTETVD
jgi:hypothetical protein